MNIRPGRLSSCFLLLLSLLLLSGCGSGKKATVHGTVTYEGEKLEGGFISFYPEGGKGTEAGGEIVDGEYTVDKVTPGKNRVQIIITEQQNAPSDNPTKSREGANAERLGKMKKRQAATKPAIPKDASGNNQVVDIPAGASKFDIPLSRPKSK